MQALLVMLPSFTPSAQVRSTPQGKGGALAGWEVGEGTGEGVGWVYGQVCMISLD